ncbi:hypothetical protein [Rhodococcus sp. RCBS9]|uniref:hypothetical protein n=1 Tax=Rhodococcus sp. RCBS9 TaxID=3031999 RepID=UPI0024027E97|nr:hypothetical protein [Rhodococcus sp. RCBS9]WEX02785.1 hypothetical protein P0M12_24515 [Rhodococcus sp. RCBS9]
MVDYTQKAADAVSSQTQKQNNDLGQGEKQRQRVLKQEAEDALKARLRQVKDSNQR